MQNEIIPPPENSSDEAAASHPVRWSLQGRSADLAIQESPSPLVLRVALSQPDGTMMRDIPVSVRLPKGGDPSGLEKLVCYTWHHGNQPWIAALYPNMDSWARRNSIELKIRRQPPVVYPVKVYAQAGMLKSFLESDGEWMIYLDADVMVHPLAPHPLIDLRQEGLWVMAEPRQKAAAAAWAAWVRQYFQREVNPDYQFCNDGVWLADRTTAERFLEYLSRPMMAGAADQYCFNLWLHDAIADGKVRRRELPPEWNRLPHRPPEVPNIPGWFYHCSGPDKGKALADLQLEGFLPQPRPPISIKPWPADPGIENVIAMPFHLEADPWKGECLRYVLRSVEQHWKHDWTLVVFGTARPDWLDEGVFHLEPSYPQALLRGCSMARRVLWLNDDILFLKDTDATDLQSPVCWGDMVPELPRLVRSENRWSRARAHITGRLHHEQGVDVLPDFSTHTPYLFERDHARKVFDHFGVWHKFPMELAYHGLLGTAGRPCVENASMETRDDPAMRWLNIHDSLTADDDLKHWLSQRFPQPSRWELR